MPTSFDLLDPCILKDVGCAHFLDVSGKLHFGDWILISLTYLVQSIDGEALFQRSILEVAGELVRVLHLHHIATLQQPDLLDDGPVPHLLEKEPAQKDAFSDEHQRQRSREREKD